MTFEQAKDQVAVKYTNQSLNWDNIWSMYGRQITKEAAELYAKSKWDEACEEQRKMTTLQFYEYLEKDLKPEFKP